MPSLAEITADIVAAYVRHNSAADVPGLISTVHEALLRATQGPQSSTPASESREPAVPVKRSGTPEHLFCLEDCR